MSEQGLIRRALYAAWGTLHELSSCITPECKQIQTETLANTIRLVEEALASPVAPVVEPQSRAQVVRDVLEGVIKVCEAYALQIGDEYYSTSSKGCANAFRALLQWNESQAAPVQPSATREQDVTTSNRLVGEGSGGGSGPAKPGSGFSDPSRDAAQVLAPVVAPQAHSAKALELLEVIAKMKRQAMAVYLCADETVAKDISDTLTQAAELLLPQAPSEAVAWRKIGEDACARYVHWYSHGQSAHSGDMAYELVTAIRQMLAAAPSAGTPEEKI